MNDPSPVHPVAVSVVVSSRNRSALLPRLVGALEAQRDAPHFELVIVDDASTDDTPAVLGQLASRTNIPMRVLRQSERGGQSAGRERGWREASGQVVLFTDDDCVPADTWVAQMYDALEACDLAQGRTVPAPAQAANNGPFSRTLDIAEANGAYATCNMGYRRERLEQAGGFDPSYRQFAGEDTDLALRCLEAGASFTFVEQAVVNHDVRPSSFVAALNGTWRWQTLPKAVARHPSLREVYHSRWFWRETHVPTTSALAGLLAALILSVIGRRGAAVVVGALGLGHYTNYRLRRVPLTLHKPSRIALLVPGFVIDAAEVGVMILGSVKARRLLL